MKTLPILFLLAATAGPGALAARAPSDETTPADTAAPDPGVVGEWAGSLDVGGTKLRLGLSVTAAADGTLTAVLDSIDQGAKVPVDTVSYEPPEVRLALPAIGASYAGALSADGSVIEGTWSQGGRQFSLGFHRVDQPVALVRPQMPQPPFPYESHEVTFESAAGGVRLAGSLLVPEGDGPFPAVVFVSGSGPQDRDETLVGHKPFLVIADALARRGVASLRFDDRGAGESGGDHFGSTVADFTADAEAAVAFLAARPEVDRRAVGIVGHSEGGVVGPRAALARPDVHFLVLLAPPAEPLDALLARQAGAILRQGGVPAELIERLAADQAEDLALVRDASIPRERLEDLLRERYALRGGDYSDQELAQLGSDPAAIEQGIRVSSSPWFRSLMREEPAERLRRLEIPVLALFGGKDLQVDAEVNAEIAKAALRPSEHAGTEVRILPGLNHLFQHTETGAPQEYGTIEETIAPEVLDAIGGWIEARARELGEAEAPNGRI